LADALGVVALPDTGSRRLLVVDRDEAPVGLLVDGVDGILRLPESAIDPLPKLLHRASGVTAFDAVGRPAGGGPLVGILSLTKLFGNRGDNAAVPPRNRTQGPQRVEALEKFVIFALGHETYGMPAGGVDEVINLPQTLSRIPRSAAFIVGLANLRGRAVPILDLRLRFGTSVAAAGSQPRVLVVRLGDIQAGLVVDAVSEVMTVAADEIVPAPPFAKTQVFGQVANLERDGRLILLVDPEDLLSRTERDSLAGTASAGQLDAAS
jgi:purine-binding chemotaxis protein CheW